MADSWFGPTKISGKSLKTEKASMYTIGAFSISKVVKTKSGFRQCLNPLLIL